MEPRERGGHSPRWAAEPEKIIIMIINYIFPMLSGTVLDDWLNSSRGEKRMGAKSVACTLPPDLTSGSRFANH
jgi:hypothetical protein